MMEDIIQSHEDFSIEDCLPYSITDQFLNLDFEADLFEETLNNTNTTSENDVPIAPNIHTTTDRFLPTPTFPCYDPPISYSNSNSSELFSIFLNTQPISNLSNKPQNYYQNQFNQMVSPDAYVSYSPDSILNPLDMHSTLQTCNSYVDGCYGDGMGVQLFQAGGAEGELGFYAGAGMGVGPPEGLDLYATMPMQRIYAPRDLQVLGDNHPMMGGCSSNIASLNVTSDIPTFEDSSYKVGRLSIEERKEKIERFLRKRHARNFNKKIKYECRKTLADSRPRVRGRFAKNDEFSDATPRPNSANHEYDDEAMEVKNAEELIESPDILAHLTDLTSFKYDNACEPWLQ